MRLYQLGEYNDKQNLSNQSMRIRDFVLFNHDFNSIKNFVNEFETLEQESIIILKRAILAGYWYSFYGFGWSKEQEIEFWELVYQKSSNSGVAILTLAESYRVHEIKTLKEVLHLYYKAIEINFIHFYSLEPGDVDIILKDEELKYDFIDLEILVLENSSEIEDLEEELPYVLNQCRGDEELAFYKTNRIKELIEKKKIQIKS